MAKCEEMKGRGISTILTVLIIFNGLSSVIHANDLYPIWDEAGLGFDVYPYVVTRLSGDWIGTISVKEEHGEFGISSEGAAELKFEARMAGPRKFYSYYDNMDPEDVRFQLLYQGMDRDLIKTLSIGHLRIGLPERVAFLSDMGIFGITALGGLGTKSILSVSGGIRKTLRKTDFLTGISTVDTLQFRPYKLSYGRIIPGTEKVKLDGELLQRDLDYIIDYRSGIIVFSPERRIEERNEIQVDYEYLTMEEESSKILCINGEVSFGDPLLLSSTYLYDPQEAGSMGILDMGTEIRLSPSILASLINILPFISMDEFPASLDIRGEIGLIAGKDRLPRGYEILLSSPVFDFKWIDRDYGPIRVRETPFGWLESESSIYAKIKPVPWLPIYFRSEMEASEGSELSRRSLGLLLNYPSLPSVLFELSNRKTYSPQMKRDIENLRVNVSYDLHPRALAFLGGMRRVRIVSNYAISEDMRFEDGDRIGYRTSDGFMRVNLSPRLGIDIYSAYGSRTVEELKGSHYFPNTRSHNALIRATAQIKDVLIPTLYGELAISESYKGDPGGSKDVLTNGFLTANVGIIPGNLLSLLSPVTLEVGFMVQGIGEISEEEEKGIIDVLEDIRRGREGARLDLTATGSGSGNLSLGSSSLAVRYDAIKRLGTSSGNDAWARMQKISARGELSFQGSKFLLLWYRQISEDGGRSIQDQPFLALDMRWGKGANIRFGSSILRRNEGGSIRTDIMPSIRGRWNTTFSLRLDVPSLRISVDVPLSIDMSQEFSASFGKYRRTYLSSSRIDIKLREGIRNTLLIAISSGDDPSPFTLWNRITARF